jgi:hypothetical protein
MPSVAKKDEMARCVTHHLGGRRPHRSVSYSLLAGYRFGAQREHFMLVWHFPFGSHAVPWARNGEWAENVASRVAISCKDLVDAKSLS